MAMKRPQVPFGHKEDGGLWQDVNEWPWLGSGMLWCWRSADLRYPYLLAVLNPHPPARKPPCPRQTKYQINRSMKVAGLKKAGAYMQHCSRCHYSSLAEQQEVSQNTVKVAFFFPMNGTMT